MPSEKYVSPKSYLAFLKLKGLAKAEIIERDSLNRIIIARILLPRVDEDNIHNFQLGDVKTVEQVINKLERIGFIERKHDKGWKLYIRQNISDEWSPYLEEVHGMRIDRYLEFLINNNLVISEGLARNTYGEIIKGKFIILIGVTQNNYQQFIFGPIKTIAQIHDILKHIGFRRQPPPEPGLVMEVMEQDTWFKRFMQADTCPIL